MRYLLTVALTIMSANAHALLLGDAANGRVVHDDKCTACHQAQFGGDGAQVYTRSNRGVKTIEGLLGRVEFCNKQTGAALSEDQINDVTKYLNDAFYKFE